MIEQASWKCASCGGENPGAAQVCGQCSTGRFASNIAPAMGTPPANGAGFPATTQPGLDEGAASALSYAFVWVSGLIFLIIDKRPSVKFHAAQSIAFCICVAVAYPIMVVVSILLGVISMGVLAVLVWSGYAIGIFGTWILLMYKAYRREKFKLPIVGSIVSRMVGQ